MSSSNITGSSNLQDLSILVQQLQSTVTNVSTSFTSLQNNISSLNQVDTVHNKKFLDINTLDGQQDAKLENLKSYDLSNNVKIQKIELDISNNKSNINFLLSDVVVLKKTDLSYNVRINNIKSKFPLTNSSINDETININKIKDLSDNLDTINNEISTLKTDVIDLKNVDVSYNDRINDLEAKFPLTNSSINDETININKIKDLSDNLNNINNKINNNLNNISTLKTDVIDLKNVDISYNDRINDLEAKFPLTNSSINDETININKIKDLNSNLSTLNNKINSNKDDISSIKTNVTNLQTGDLATDLKIVSLQSKFPISNSSITDNTISQSKIQDLTGDLSTINSKINTNKDDITTLKNTDISYNSRLNNLENKFPLTNSSINDETLNINKIKDLSSNLSTINDKLNTNKGDISSLKSDVVDLKNTDISYNTRLENIEAKFPITNSSITDETLDINKIKDLSSNLSTINDKLNTNEDDINILKSDIVDLKNYDTSNNLILANINTTLSTHTTDINLLKNTTLPSLDDKYVKLDGSSYMTGSLLVNNVDCSGNLTLGSNASYINIGGGTNNDEKIIDIGGPNDKINIIGSSITLNQGIKIKDNSNNNIGYITTDISNNEFLFKAPNSDTLFKIKQSPKEFYDLVPKIYVDLNTSALQSSITGLNATTTDLAYQITTINNNTINDVAFSRVNAWPSNNEYVLNGLGEFVKVNDNVIENNTINPLKLTGADGSDTKILFADGTFKTAPSSTFNSTTIVSDSNLNDGSINTSKLSGISTNNSGNKYLNDKGQFAIVPTFNNKFTADVDAQNYLITNLSDPVNSQDASTKNYVDNKYLGTLSASTQVIQPVGLGTPQIVNKLNVLSNLNMNNNLISNVLNPVSAQDSATKYYVDNKTLDSFGLPINDINLNSKKITNLLNPTNAQDGATKNYVDNKIVSNSNITDGSINLSKLSGTNGTGANVLLDNGTFGKIDNNDINDNTINGSKIVDSSITTTKISGVSNTNSGNNYLNDKGQFVTVSGGSSFNNQFTAEVNANNNKITNLGVPTLNNDATTKTYVDSKTLNSFTANAEISTNNNNINVGTGTTKTNNISASNSASLNILTQIDMGNRKIINVSDPTNAQDVSTKNYIDNKKLNNFSANAEVSLSNNNLNVGSGTVKTNNILNQVDLNNNKIINVANPVNNQDVVNLQYLNTTLTKESGSFNNPFTMTTTINCYYPVKLVICNIDSSTSGYGNGVLTCEFTICSNQQLLWNNIRYYVKIEGAGASSSGAWNTYANDTVYNIGTYYKLKISYNILVLYNTQSMQNTYYKVLYN